MLRTTVIALLIATSAFAQQRSAEEERLHSDWAYLARFRDENAKLPPPSRGEKRVVFMGDSITQVWANFWEKEFDHNPYINRGISGQTTPQMLVRFRPDVIDLKPSAVVILAGINDIAGNTGSETVEMIEGNIRSMAELARANNIAVVLCSILPANRLSWRPDIAPAESVLAINRWMEKYAADHGMAFVDYWTAMADEQQGLPERLSRDGVHPNEAGYEIMAPLVERGIAKALRKR